MNNATLATLSNVSLLPICYYISAFSTFFISKDLMTINDENQSIPVINALFEYLNKSKNQSLAKTQLLLEVLHITNFNQGSWNRTLGKKDVNETYQYIITASFLHHCGNITGYPSGYANGKESIPLSEFRTIEGLLEKCINHNPCSIVNETRKLTSLAIEKLLEHIWPVYNQEKILNETKRFKRQPPTYTHNFHILDSELESVIASKMNTDPYEHFDFTDEQKKHLYSFLLDPRDSTNSINTHGEYFNDQSSGSDFSLLTSEENLDRGQQNDTNSELEEEKAKFLTVPYELFDYTYQQQQPLYSFLQDPRDSTNSINTHGEYFDYESNGNNSLLLTSGENLDRQQNAGKTLPNVLETSEIVEIGNKRPHSTIDNDLDSDSVPSTSKKTRYALLQEYANFERQRNGSLEIEDGGKSRRMLCIQEAAKIMCSCKRSLNFNNTVDMLKGFLLKLEIGDPLVPSYNKFANEFCANLELPSGYDGWKIPTNCTFIDDVLFKSHLDAINMTEFKTGYPLFQNYPLESFEKDIKIYQSSMKLRKSLRIEEFLVIRYHLLYSSKIQTGKKAGALRKITTALYNLALRECEEDWINEKITLYAIDFDYSLRDLRNNSSARTDYTFKKYVEFFADFSKAKSKLKNFQKKVSNLVLFTIEFENLAGIANIDRIFEDNSSGRYMVPINMSFPITQAEAKSIDKYKIFSIEMRDNRLKEDKMVEIVKTLAENSPSNDKCNRKKNNKKNEKEF